MQAHARLTPQEVKELYNKKILTSKGYIYLYFLSLKKAGWKIRGTVSKLCQELEVPKSTFYRVLTELACSQVLEFQIHGEVEIQLTNKPLEETDLAEKSVPKMGQLSQDWDNFPKNETDFPNVETDFPNVETVAPSKVAQGEDSNVSPTLFNSLSSLSLNPPAHLREEKEFSGNVEDQQAEEHHDRQQVRELHDVITDRATEGKNSLSPDSFTDRELLDFIAKSNPEAKRPQAYARSCLKNDRDYWYQEYQNHQKRIRDSENFRQGYYQEFVPPPEEPIDREKALENLKKLRQMLEGRNSK